MPKNHKIWKRSSKAPNECIEQIDKSVLVIFPSINSVITVWKPIREAQPIFLIVSFDSNQLHCEANLPSPLPLLHRCHVIDRRLKIYIPSSQDVEWRAVYANSNCYRKSIPIEIERWHSITFLFIIVVKLCLEVSFADILLHWISIQIIKTDRWNLNVTNHHHHNYSLKCMPEHVCGHGQTPCPSACWRRGASKTKYTNLFQKNSVP